MAAAACVLRRVQSVVRSEAPYGKVCAALPASGRRDICTLGAYAARYGFRRLCSYSAGWNEAVARASEGVSDGVLAPARRTVRGLHCRSKRARVTTEGYANGGGSYIYPDIKVQKLQSCFCTESTSPHETRRQRRRNRDVSADGGVDDFIRNNRKPRERQCCNSGCANCVTINQY